MQSAIHFSVVESSHTGNEQPWLYEGLARPPIYVEAMHLVVRFFQALRDMPETFRGRLYQAVLMLDRAIARLGAKLEQLGTNRRLLFRDAHKLIQSL